MSVICQNNCGWVIDHGQAVAEMYKNVWVDMDHQQTSCSQSEKTISHFQLKENMFALHRSFMMDSHFEKQQQETQDGEEIQKKRKRKRKLRTQDAQDELTIEIHAKLEEAHDALLQSARSEGYLIQLPSLPDDNNRSARTAAMIEGPGNSLSELCEMSKMVTLYEIPLSIDDPDEADTILRNENLLKRRVEYKGSKPVLATFLGGKYILPARSSFVMSDLEYLLSEPQVLQVAGGYDLIVVDPPWQNKSVKRKKSYYTVSEETLTRLPVPILAAPDCLVVVWVTNKPRLLEFVRERLFPAWTVEYCSQWHWVKVTTSGSLVCDINSTLKKPYETIILGRFQGVPKGDNFSIPTDRIIMSIPCSLHSKKPPLGDILKSYLPKMPQCLELFARNLWHGWTSWGNEVLKHQHIDYYEDKT